MHVHGGGARVRRRAHFDGCGPRRRHRRGARGAGAIVCRTLGGGAPRGLCGSGLVDAVAAGLELGRISASGRMTAGASLPLAGAVTLSQATCANSSWRKARSRPGYACLPCGWALRWRTSGGFTWRRVRKLRFPRQRTAHRVAAFPAGAHCGGGQHGVARGPAGVVRGAGGLGSRSPPRGARVAQRRAAIPASVRRGDAVSRVKIPRASGGALRANCRSGFTPRFRQTIAA